MLFFPPISEVPDRRHSAREKPYPDLLLANCSVLFHGYMSAQAVIVSVIITTCSVAPFRFHHLCCIKQPAAGSRVDCPGAATVRLWISEYNCCLSTNISPPPSLKKKKQKPQPSPAYFLRQRSELYQMQFLPSTGIEATPSVKTAGCLLLVSGMCVSKCSIPQFSQIA